MEINSNDIYVDTHDFNRELTLPEILKRYMDINGTYEGFEEYVSCGFRNGNEIEYLKKEDGCIIKPVGETEEFVTFEIDYEHLSGDDCDLSVIVHYTDEVKTLVDMMNIIRENIIDIANCHIMNKAFWKATHIMNVTDKVTDSQHTMLLAFTDITDMLEEKGITVVDDCGEN